MEKLLIASTNEGKIREIKDYFSDLSYEINGLKAYPDEIGVIIEDGNSFAENALKKARVGSNNTGLCTLADDSGLVVEYLDGAPGIYSARFAGGNATDRDNNEKLLKMLKGVPREQRSAYFKCVMALIFPENNKEFTFEGICEGKITKEPRGEHGFGYDPVFYVPEYDKTMAELDSSLKNKISHRAKALKKVKEFLKNQS